MTLGLMLKDVKISLGGRTLLRLSKTVAPGDVLTVMGDSGAGKSTLLEYVGGFLRPPFEASGRLILNNRDITTLSPRDRHVGFMFQSPLLFPHMSVRDNLLFGLPNGGMTKHERATAVEASLCDIGMDDFADRDPATLSGGQQTRIALMRLLMAEPEALLLDEPFSSLDQSRRADLRDLVFKLARERGLPVLLVTHDKEDADAAGGDLVEL
ncbi:ATP-binding cassette domain-containing protein [Roseibium polysiphoniae]|uniref:ATP-binding cassette domain-containing protein n=1 Tax=Roseibium polysiphoniae TaxID=2571221 RepID=A0A944GUK7_9HYPH|nr:ATP-binding cassette domain-containing protein [Roseibium polysiphoniae]MBS8262462.1 ATP-binding cassette domain-containing protein [Roseibium polysiphoniae]